MTEAVADDPLHLVGVSRPDDRPGGTEHRCALRAIREPAAILDGGDHRGLADEATQVGDEGGGHDAGTRSMPRIVADAPTVGADDAPTAIGGAPDRRCWRRLLPPPRD